MPWGGTNGKTQQMFFYRLSVFISLYDATPCDKHLSIGENSSNNAAMILYDGCLSAMWQAPVSKNYSNVSFN